MRRNEGEQVAFQAEEFSARRAELAAAVAEVLADDQSASVDRLDFDPEGPTILLQVRARSITGQSSRDATWRVTQAMLRLWEPELMALVPNAVPSFSLSVNGRRIVCGPDVMIQLGGKRAARELWEEQCR